MIDTTVNFLIKSRNISAQLNSEIYTMSEPDSLIHLLHAWLPGLDSMVFGETEILGQLKETDIALSVNILEIFLIAHFNALLMWLKRYGLKLIFKREVSL